MSVEAAKSRLEAARLRNEIAKVFDSKYALVSEHSPGVFEVRLLVSELALRDSEGHSEVLTRIRDMVLQREAFPDGDEDETEAS